MRRAAVLWFIVSAATFVSAQINSAAEDQAPSSAVILQRLDALEQRVQQLEEQNRALRAQLSGGATPAVLRVSEAAPATSAQAATTQSRPAAPQSMPGMSGATAGEPGPSLKLRGFADVDFATTDTKTQTQGFQLGQFVLHMSSALAPKTSFFGELSFSARPTGYAVEVERSIIRYDVNDYLKVSFGKYHTPINYWNTAFHHGAWLQTTISRPEMIQFGGRFLPVHFVGAQAEGAIPSGPLGLNYNFGVGNGRQTISLLSRDSDAGDVNSNRAWVANLFARPAALYGLQVGGSVYRDLVSPDSAPATSYRELISAAHIVWNKETPEFYAEFANVHHSDVRTSRDWNSQGMYTQLAYRLPGGLSKWKPYYRYEYIHAPATEPVLQVQNLLGGHTVGTRYDVTDFAAFKLEFRHFNRGQHLESNGLFLQTAFTF